MSRIKVVVVFRADASGFLAKARQFAAQARSAVDSAHHDAALLNAVHAAISGADAVAVAIGGRRSADPDHLRVADLLDELADDVEGMKVRTKQLRALLKKKHSVAYEARPTTAREAMDGVERSERFVQWAAQVVESTKL